MIIAASWALFALGIAHILTGLVLFRQPLGEALRDGFFGQFASTPSRRLAFWFTIFGPLVAMGGQVALHAAYTSDLELLKIVGFYVLATSVVALMAVPKSPFWIPLVVAPVLIAGGFGWLG